MANLEGGWSLEESHPVCYTARPVFHDDVIKWKHFPRYWPFVRGIHRSPVNSPHKGQWRGALVFSLICVWINGWVNNREAGDLKRYRAHYDVIVMLVSSHLIKSLQLIWRSGATDCKYSSVKSIGDSQMQTIWVCPGWLASALRWDTPDMHQLAWVIMIVAFAVEPRHQQPSCYIIHMT